MATEIDRLEIKITADATQADKSLNKLVKSLRKVHKNMGHTTSSAKKMGQSTKEFKKFDGTMRSSAKSAKSLASAIGKFYATYFLVIRGMKQLWKAIESTTDYIEAFNYQNVALGKIASEWKHQYEKYGYENAEEYAKSFKSRLQDELGKLSGVRFDEEQMRLVATETKNLGLNLKEVTQYASQLASVTNSVGLTGESSIAASSSFTKLAGDISSLFNVDYSEVAKNLQSGLIGQSRALYKYGIDITNATLQTKAYELGLNKAVSEMTQAEKMQLRMIAILEQSKVSWGDLANTINSPSNMIRQFKNNLKEVGLVLGQLFIPLLEKVIPFLNGVSLAIKRLLVDVAGFFGIEINVEEFGQGYTDLEDDLDGVEDGFDDATESAKKFKSQLQGFDKLNVLSSSTGANGSLLETLDLTEEILKATAEYEKVWGDAFDKMQSKAEEWAKKFENTFANIKNMFKNLSEGKWFEAGQDFNSIISGIFTSLAEAINKVNWSLIGENIGKFLSGADLKELAKTALDAFLAIFKALGEMFVGMFKEAPLETTALVALLFGGGSLFGGLGGKGSATGGNSASRMPIWPLFLVTEKEEYDFTSKESIDALNAGRDFSDKIKDFFSGGYNEPDKYYTDLFGEVKTSNKTLGESIKKGAEDVISRLESLVDKQNKILEGILEKDTSISSRSVFEAVRGEYKSYIGRTGVSVFD